MSKPALFLVAAVFLAACPPTRLEAPVPPGAVEFRLESSPPGASINVDGVPQGNTPVTVHLRPGTHRVSMSKNGYLTLDAQPEVAAGGVFKGDLVASH